jgi:hypothetical protein
METCNSLPDNHQPPSTGNSNCRQPGKVIVAIQVAEIRKKYGLKRLKPDPVTVTLVRPCCGKQFVHLLKQKKEAKSLKDPRCMEPQCRLKVLVMPFGKFAGLTIPLVYEQQPSYLAWFHETVEGRDEIKEAIRALDGIEAHLAAFRQKPRQPSSPRKLNPTQQDVEWLMGKFSASTIDKVCDELFGGKG